MASRMSENNISNFQDCFIWKILSFSVLKYYEGLSMKSRKFKAKSKSGLLRDQGLKLCASLHSEDLDSIIIDLLIDKDNMNIRNCKYSVGIIGTDGSLYHSETQSLSFDRDIIGCFFYCIEKDKLEDKALSFPDGSLFLKFELHDVELDFSATQNFIESNISECKIYFNYFVESLYSLTPQYISFECPVLSKYTMFVYRHHDEIKIEVKNHIQVFRKEAAIKVTLFDINGCELYSKWYRTLFTKDENLYLLQPPIPIKLVLGRKHKKEITFNLLCELHDFKSEEECVISANYAPQYFLNSCRSNNFYKLSDIQKDLLSLFKEAMLSDIKLKAGDKIFPVHRIILSTRSPILREMLENKDLNFLNILDVEALILEKFLKFLYFGTVELLDYETAFKLLFLSNRYQVKSLKDKCLSFLRKILSEKYISPVKH